VRQVCACTCVNEDVCVHVCVCVSCVYACVSACVRVNERVRMCRYTHMCVCVRVYVHRSWRWHLQCRLATSVRSPCNRTRHTYCTHETLHTASLSLRPVHTHTHTHARAHELISTHEYARPNMPKHTQAHLGYTQTRTSTHKHTHTLKAVHT